MAFVRSSRACFGLVLFAVFATACGSSAPPEEPLPPPLPEFKSTVMRLTLVKAEDDKGARVEGGIGGITLFLKAGTATKDGKLLFDRGSAEVVVGEQPGTSGIVTPFSSGYLSVSKGDVNKPYEAIVDVSEVFAPRTLTLTHAVTRKGMSHAGRAFGTEAFAAKDLERLSFPADGITFGGELTGTAAFEHADGSTTGTVKLTFRLTRDEEPAKVALSEAYADGTYPHWVNPGAELDKPVTFTGPIMRQSGDGTPVEYDPKGGVWSSSARAVRLIYPEGVDYAGLPVPARTVEIKPTQIASKAAFDFSLDRPFLGPRAEVVDDADCEKGRCVVVRGNTNADEPCRMPPHMGFALERPGGGEKYSVRIRLLGQTNKAWKKVFLSRPWLNNSITFGIDETGPTAEGPPRTDYPYDSGWISLDTSSSGETTFVLGIHACAPGLKMLVQGAGVASGQ